MDNNKTTPIQKTVLTQQLYNHRISAYRRYLNKAVGGVSAVSFLRYELATTVLGNLGGAVGYYMRKRLYKPLFRSFGSGVILGKGINLRHPSKIALGDRVAIDDYCLLDAGGSGEKGVSIGDDVVISRNCVVQGKTGSVTIGSGADIGCNTVITSAAGIEVGEQALIAANCYIGGARYFTEDRNASILIQGTYSRGPVVLGDGIWLGAGVIVLDGVRIGKGAIVGAGSVVVKSIPAFSIALGIPAKAVSFRKGEK